MRGKGTGPKKTEAEKTKKPTSEATEEVKGPEEEVAEEVTQEPEMPEENAEDLALKESAEPEAEAIEEVEKEVQEPVAEEPIAISPEPEGPPSAGVAISDDLKVRPPKTRKKVKMVRIIIDRQDNSDKNIDVKCTDGQGRQFVIKRGFEVDVPIGVLNVLRESIQTTLEMNEQGDERYTDIPRIAVRLIKEL